MDPWNLRTYREEFAGRGWRIQEIPYRHSQTVWPFALGGLCFIGGVAAMIGSGRAWWLLVSVGGLAFGFGGNLVMARVNRSGWIKVDAVCTDREIRRVRTGKGGTWTFRLLCHFQHQGSTFWTTPYYWRAFCSEAGVNQFLENHIGQDGRCFLYINPKEPRQADLAGGGIFDLVMH